MKDITIVIIGKSGQGKSKTGNTILGRDEFESRMSASSVTTTCQVASAQRFGNSSKVIDTPGFSDTQLSDQQIRAEVTRSVHLSTPGPHVFILVVRPERFTVEEQRAFALTKEYFGNGIVNRLIVLFAKRDQLDHEGLTLPQFLSTAPPELQTLIHEAGNRYIAFNNRTERAELDSQTQTLMNMIESLLVTCGNTRYTPKLLEDAEMERQRQERLRQEEEQQRIQAEKDAILAEEQRKAAEEFERQRLANEERIRQLEAEKAQLAAPAPPQPTTIHLAASVPPQLTTIHHHIPLDSFKHSMKKISKKFRR